jgi:microcin C transport system substrate-binding protein
VAPDFGSVSFRLRPEARFNNGDPVLAEDVKHSFAMLTARAPRPAYQTRWRASRGWRVLDARTVRFEFKERRATRSSLPPRCRCSARKWGAGKTMDQIVTELPITSGPYVIDKVDMPRRIEFKRNPDYWARDLPVRRGTSTSSAWSTACTGQRSRWRPSRPASSTSSRSYRSRTWVRLHAGPSGTTGASSSGHATGFGQHACRRQPQHAPAQVPGHPRARGAGLHLRLRHAGQAPGLHARQQRLQQLRVRGRGHCPVAG